MLPSYRFARKSRGNQKNISLKGTRSACSRHTGPCSKRSGTRDALSPAGRSCYSPPVTDEGAETVSLRNLPQITERAEAWGVKLCWEQHPTYRLAVIQMFIFTLAFVC